MSLVPSAFGFLLLDSSLNLLAANSDVLQILCYPSQPEKIKQPKVFIPDRVRTTLVDHHHHNAITFVKEFKSGRRRYVCNTLQIDCQESSPPQIAYVLVLERTSANIRDASGEYDLTERERETVELLLQGFTSKEIANRMNISPNTVKAFLRLVMVKMKVSTRSGIAGKVSRFTNGNGS